MARPTIYTEELINKICKRMEEGESLKKICADPSMPVRSTIYEWLLDKDKKEFSDKYEKASNTRTEQMFDELEEIASNPKIDVKRARLMTDVRKWYLSKIVPKKYGDKIDLTSGGDKITQPSNSAILELAEQLYQLDEANFRGNKPSDGTNTIALDKKASD